MPNWEQEWLRRSNSSPTEEEEDSPKTEGSRRRRRERWLWRKAMPNSRANWLQEWNRVFLLVCAAGLFIDPLFFYALSISDAAMCLFVDGWFAVTVTVLRCMTDALHLWNMWLQFKLNRRRRRDGDGKDAGISAAVKYFLFDLFVILPLPQT
ncbi:cyclic nucleotide-gated ion channel 4-like [Andrographis paniculata]|uniref:cyclic nucleotide-gated ion channel 4-like n=1 Tax=Andrographis paniculata TaxID=175694 RepID=UPI0021E7CFDC|nr:cyclic nucleotide-gated ion channel 4-like [Andrographis paniculata]